MSGENGSGDFQYREEALVGMEYRELAVADTGARRLERNPGLVLIIIMGNARPKVIKLFSCSTQMSKKFSLLINVKMPTIVCISTFISTHQHK